MDKPGEKHGGGRQRAFNNVAVAVMVVVIVVAALAWGGMVFDLLPF